MTPPLLALFFQAQATCHCEKVRHTFAMQYSVNRLIQQRFGLAFLQHSLLRRHACFEGKSL
ncbi:hypothetical protein D3C87_1637930 [compost metagenome]